MDHAILAEIEDRFSLLTLSEQRWLLAYLIRQWRQRAVRFRDSELRRMADDPEIVMELRKIEAEFRQTEADGLEPT